MRQYSSKLCLSVPLRLPWWAYFRQQFPSVDNLVARLSMPGTSSMKTQFSQLLLTVLASSLPHFALSKKYRQICMNSLNSLCGGWDARTITSPKARATLTPASLLPNKGSVCWAVSPSKALIIKRSNWSDDACVTGKRIELICEQPCSDECKMYILLQVLVQWRRKKCSSWSNQTRHPPLPPLLQRPIIADNSSSVNQQI